MVDTALPKSECPSKILVRVKDGVRYYKRGGYVCDFCPYADNKTCSMCVFANFNVHGVKAGFSPKDAYRKAHKNDVSASPLMQQFRNRLPIDNHVALDHVLPEVQFPHFPVKTFQGMLDTLKRVRIVRKSLG